MYTTTDTTISFLGKQIKRNSNRLHTHAGLQETFRHNVINCTLCLLNYVTNTTLLNLQFVSLTRLNHAKLLANPIAPFMVNSRLKVNDLQEEWGRGMVSLQAKIGAKLQPVFSSKKIGQNPKPKESKPPVVNKQCAVYNFQCNYVVYTTRYLHQRIQE